ncbi:phosphate ABC transporter permease PstA [Arcanobacterium haemolyticum]|nr:phosphate ABC transporter permease PstA [Arcanobacterium haemolyticum]
MISAPQNHDVDSSAKAQDVSPAVDTPAVVFAKYGRRLPKWAPWAALIGSALTSVLFFQIIGGGTVFVELVVALLIYVVLMFVLSKTVEGGRQGSDRMATTLITGSFLLALVPLASLLVTVLVSGFSKMSVQFLTNTTEGMTLEGAVPGAGHAILGTLEVTASTAIIAIPLGILTAIYLVEYRGGWLSRVITFLVDIMTGIPSIVAGLFAAAMLPVLIGDPGYRSGFMGALALVVLMTPIVVRNTEEMLRLVSNELREASYALGVTKSRTIVKVVLRTALPGIVSGCVIAIARIIGESAPLLITAGSTDYYNFSMFNDRVMTLPVFVYGQYVAGNFDMAWAGALILVVIVLILNLFARLIAKWFAPKGE